MFARILGSLGARAARPRVLWALVRLVTCHVSLVIFLIGCKKSESPIEPKSAATNAPANSALAGPKADADGPAIARLHWIGKKNLAADTNSAYLMTIWNLPESAKLEAQTLNKLAIAPWLATLTNRPPVITNYDEVVASHPAASLLHPLLNDLLQEEWHMEVKSAESRVQSGTNSPAGMPALPAEFTLAIRLDDKQDALWRSNLPKAYKALPTNSQPSTLNSQLSFSRSSPWTLVTLAPGLTPPAAELLRRLGTSQPSTLNSQLPPGWLDGMLDLPKLATALGGHLSSDWPQVTLSVTGDGQNVRTRAELEFSSPLPIELEPWNIPTNLIHDPLIGFMAVRGVRPWLEKCKALTDLNLGKLPNQAFVWAQAGMPSQHYLAVPSVAASNQFDKLSEFVVRELNPILASNRFGTFELTPDEQRLKWRGIPWFSPTLATPIQGNQPFIFAGFSPVRLTNKPIPPELLVQLYTTTNLVLYDWEITKPIIDGLGQVIQMSRLTFGLSRMTHTAAQNFLLASFTNLGNTISAAKLESPTRVTFTRTSNIGFTGAELELFADWVESPNFPFGLHTFDSPKPPPFGRKPQTGTNSPNADAETGPNSTPATNEPKPTPGKPK